MIDTVGDLFSMVSGVGNFASEVLNNRIHNSTCFIVPFGVGRSYTSHSARLDDGDTCRGWRRPTFGGLDGRLQEVPQTRKYSLAHGLEREVASV